MSVNITARIKRTANTISNSSLNRLVKIVRLLFILVIGLAVASDAQTKVPFRKKKAKDRKKKAKRKRRKEKEREPLRN